VSELDRRLEEIRARAAAAQPGPWFWTGNVDSHNLRLASRASGLPTVIDFRRSGMQGARPRFGPGPGGFYMQDAHEVPVFQVCREATERSDPRVYRGDVVGFRNPNADFIAAARSDIDYLLGVIDVLENRLKDCS
jgi:hypothetical protein